MTNHHACLPSPRESDTIKGNSSGMITKSATRCSNAKTKLSNHFHKRKPQRMERMPSQTFCLVWIARKLPAKSSFYYHSNFTPFQEPGPEIFWAPDCSNHVTKWQHETVLGNPILPQLTFLGTFPYKENIKLSIRADNIFFISQQITPHWLYK